jgi:hypothetical protein
MLFGIYCLDMAAADSIRVIDDDYVKRVHSFDLNESPTTL